MIPLLPNQNTAPALARAVLLINSQPTIWPSVQPSCQSIAPPLIEAVLSMKVDPKIFVSCASSKYIAPPKPSFKS